MLTKLELEALQKLYDECEPFEDNEKIDYQSDEFQLRAEKNQLFFWAIYKAFPSMLDMLQERDAS